MKNNLIVIGYLGVRQAYLNVTVEEAKRRYAEINPEHLDPYFKIIEFDDEFCVYDAWEN